MPAGSFADKGGRQTIDVVRGGLSYKFDSASSPLSAYAADMPVKAAGGAGLGLELGRFLYRRPWWLRLEAK